jgi:hypothetical protein
MWREQHQIIEGSLKSIIFKAINLNSQSAAFNLNQRSTRFRERSSNS